MIAQHNELYEAIPNLEADVQAHKLKIDLAQHAGDFVMETVDNLAETNEEEHEVLATQIQELDVKIQSTAENQMRATTFPGPAVGTSSFGEQNQSGNRQTGRFCRICYAWCRTTLQVIVEGENRS